MQRVFFRLRVLLPRASVLGQPQAAVVLPSKPCSSPKYEQSPKAVLQLLGIERPLQLVELEVALQQWVALAECHLALLQAQLQQGRGLPSWWGLALQASVLRAQAARLPQAMQGGRAAQLKAARAVLPRPAAAVVLLRRRTCRGLTCSST